MKTLKIILIILLAVIIIAFAFLWWVGYFSKVQPYEKEQGGYVVAGIEFVGNYSKVGTPMMKVDSILRSAGIECTKGFGIYYDDPKKTPKDQCRSYVGNIIETKDTGKIEMIKAMGLKIDSIPLKQSVIIEFPIRNNISYFIGPMKAYPVLGKYIGEKEYAVSLCYELYDMEKKTTYYTMQVYK